MADVLKTNLAKKHKTYPLFQHHSQAMNTLTLTLSALGTIQTLDASEFQLLSAEKYSGETIPFSHIYATSDTYLKLIKSTQPENQSSIIRISEKQSELIKQQKDHPVNISSFDAQSINDLNAIYGEKQNINLGVINGIGLNFNDNFIGLGIIQRLAKLLKPRKITISLMQTLNTRFDEIYQQEFSRDNLEVKIHNNCTSLNNFFKLDAYVDLSSIMKYEEYNNTSLANFYATAFSIENLIPKRNILPKINSDNEKTLYFVDLFDKTFKEERPTVLFNVFSSLKYCSQSAAKEMVSSIISEGYNVISDVADLIDSDYYSDCVNPADGFVNLMHTILACDFVITPDPITYSLASSLSKPVILLPTYKSDIISAATLAKVLVWLPKDSASLYLDNKEQQPSTTTIDQLWSNINFEKLAKSIKPYQARFSKDSKTYSADVNNERIGVILIVNDGQKTISESLSHLTQFEEFDPLWFYTIEKSNKTLELNNVISSAMNDGCDYVWLLDNQATPDISFISHALSTFAKNSDTGIVSGSVLKNKDSKSVGRAGGSTFFPTKSYKSEMLLDNNSKSSMELWVNFSSVMLRTSMLRDIGMFDNIFYTEYKEIDLCLRSHLGGWRTYYNPDCISIKESELNDERYTSFNSDIQTFYKKWSRIIDNDDIDNLEFNIRKYVKEYLVKNMS